MPDRWMSDGAGDGGRHHARLRHVSQRDEGSAVAKGVGCHPGHPQRQPGFPTPPGPVTETNRCRCTSADRPSTSCLRPTNVVASAGSVIRDSGSRPGSRARMASSRSTRSREGKSPASARCSVAARNTRQCLSLSAIAVERQHQLLPSELAGGLLLDQPPQPSHIWTPDRQLSLSQQFLGMSPCFTQLGRHGIEWRNIPQPTKGLAPKSDGVGEQETSSTGVIGRQGSLAGFDAVHHPGSCPTLSSRPGGGSRRHRSRSDRDRPRGCGSKSASERPLHAELTVELRSHPISR